MLSVHAQDLSALNTLGLPAQAPCCIDLVDAGLPALQALSALVAQHGCGAFVLGGGSNVVLSNPLRPLVIRVLTHGVRRVEETAEHDIIEAQAGENWHAFVAHTLQSGWRGLENLALIPGTVGAAPVQNIGAYGLELDQLVHGVRAWNIETATLHTFDRNACKFAYRDSFFKREPMGRWLIVSVRFVLPKTWHALTRYPDVAAHPRVQQAGSQVTAQDIFEAVCDIRRRKLPDPAVLGNAGSFFKNPVVSLQTSLALQQRFPNLVAYPQQNDPNHVKLAAGWLIDQAGWKGQGNEKVGVHDRQALVLVNRGGATAADIQDLATQIRTDIYAKFGVWLEQEPVNVA